MGFYSDYKKENGEYPNNKKTLGYSNIFGYSYDKLKNKFKNSNSQNRSTSIKM